MAFSSWSAFWDMGGYGFFVWLAYGVSFLAIGVLIFDTWFAKRKLKLEVRRQQARKQRMLSAKELQQKL